MAHAAPHVAMAAYSNVRASKARLIEIVRDLSLLRGDEIVLSSGATSKFYFDMKPTLFDPEGATMVAALMLEKIRAQGCSIVGGLEMGAVPLVACIAQLSCATGPVQGFFVRKATKDHGTRKLIEGLPRSASLAGQRVVIVDDVTTTGGSVLRAVHAARESGANVETVLTVVDRLEGAERNLGKEGLRLIALSQSSDYSLAVAS